MRQSDRTLVVVAEQPFTELLQRVFSFETVHLSSLVDSVVLLCADEIDVVFPDIAVLVLPVLCLLSRLHIIEDQNLGRFARFVERLK